MLQRAQAGSAVSLGARSNRSLREELTERDVADRRLEGLLVQHMEDEKDRMKRITNDYLTPTNTPVQTHPSVQLPLGRS